ncbi:VanZ family protein [Clostridium beijerinckii]|uniref:VanZ family protein n=1 Tax=Clostridium beijerinckii TaxID=1520 RepID=UPI00042461C3|nr:VanZ family protein [Clostridium beijerinckii]MZK50667.1 teicoplanin resistance protein VanZ [Clostridium beijerinckii]MZK58871.1 teicoplanin resistance protein VanZ [Clostridium beijerinckii]MZK68990.1 teicoplanin resistance protein VanZ [Clostridium beijerinckii]MZK74362.1 teicoplanin resistance protein VanZ [Clostridium beijerinckii]MZK84062.1 teicoplanin resistance protein VanZ [Clostridium beijerinckii]
MKKIVILLCLFWMGFIFYMSGNNGTISHEQSTKVVNIIENAQGNKEKSQAENKDKAVNNSNSSQQNKNNINVQQEEASNLDRIVRKNAHAFMYMVLAILVCGALFSYNKSGKGMIIYILFICLFYAVTDEFHQSFIPGRTSLVSDVLVDFMGALIGLAFFYLSYYKIYKRKRL